MDSAAKLQILYATQTGTAEKFAKQLASTESLLSWFATAKNSLEEYETNNLPSEDVVIFVVSTFGNGGPPEEGKLFDDWMKISHPPELLKNVSYAVFGLGNSMYQRFCGWSKFIDKTMSQLGATALLPHTAGDALANQEEAFESWLSTLKSTLANRFQLKGKPPGKGLVGLVRKGAFYKKTSFGRENPFPSSVIETAQVSRTAFWIKLSIKDSGMSYTTGSHVAILPENNPEIVKKLAERLNISAQLDVKIEALKDKYPAHTYRSALTQVVDITSPPKASLLLLFAQHCWDQSQTDQLVKLAKGGKEYEESFKDNKMNILEILQKFPAINIPILDFLDAVPTLAVRVYSIASSPSMFADEVHVLITRLQYKSANGVQRFGICSNYLASLKKGGTVRLFILKHNNFTPNFEAPILMIGAGAGLAPFLGFLQDRSKLQQHSKPINLMIGSPTQDYILKSWLEQWKSRGFLTDIQVAVSREGPKVHLQDVIQSQSSAIWGLIQSGASVYVCGDSKMAESVRYAFDKLGEQNKIKGKLSQQMRKDGKYFEDLFGVVSHFEQLIEQRKVIREESLMKINPKFRETIHPVKTEPTIEDIVAKFNGNFAPSHTFVEQVEATIKQTGVNYDGPLSFQMGFMTEPVRIDDGNHEWEKIADKLPELYITVKVREALANMRVISIKSIDPKYWLRGSSIIAILAQSYYFCGDQSDEKLPDSIMVPWKEFAEAFGRPHPSMNYMDLILYNFKVPKGAKADLDHLKLLTPTVGNQEEELFYGVQSVIGVASAPVMSNVCLAQTAAINDDPKLLETQLKAITKTLLELKKIFVLIEQRTGSKYYINPVLWAKTVAPLAVPFIPGAAGPSGSAAPLFHMLDVFLERAGYESELGKDVLKIRPYYPKNHQKFLQEIAKVSVAKYIWGKRHENPSLMQAYINLESTYAGESGFLGTHRKKAYGFLSLAFLVGRNITIGHFQGEFNESEWQNVSRALVKAANERFGKNTLAEAPPPSVKTTVKNSIYYDDLMLHNNEKAGYWTVIGDYVYNVTNYLHVHPGGAALFIAFAGMDSTEEFVKMAHKNVDGLLGDMCIGRINKDGLSQKWLFVCFSVMKMQNLLTLEYSIRGIQLTSADKGEVTPYLLCLLSNTHKRFVSGYLNNLFIISSTIAEECNFSVVAQITELQSSAKFKWVLDHPWFRAEIESQDAQMKKQFLDKLVDLESELLAKAKDSVVSATKARRTNDLESQKKRAQEIISHIRSFIDAIFAHLRANTMF